MNILHLVAGDLSGGAARGAYWLHKGLLKLGLQSHIINNSSNLVKKYKNVHNIINSDFQKIRSLVYPQLSKLPVRAYAKRRNSIFSTGFDGFDFTKSNYYKNADIVHLHWINSLVSIHSLKNISKPIVWTLRDMWPITGGCHVSYDCMRYQEGCGRCPQLGSNSNWDLSKFILEYKKKYLPPNIHIVGISNWIKDISKLSKLFSNNSTSMIPNCIDTSEFNPIEKCTAKSLLNLPKNKKLILLGSSNLLDVYKGFHLFKKSLKYLNTSSFHFVFFGNCKYSELESLNVSYTNLGFLNDPIALRLVYSASDVYVAPYMNDSFGKTIVESMSCETPVVCFDATGPKDIIDHKINGYKALPFEPEDLAYGIVWITSSNFDYNKVKLNAREKATSHYDIIPIAKKYVNLYNKLI